MDILEPDKKWMLEQWATREAHPRWVQADALHFCWRYRKLASQKGWLLCLGGSLLDHPTGGDLDILLVNWRPNPRKSELITTVRKDYPARVVDIYEGIYGTGVGMCTEDGFLIDLYFRVNHEVRTED